MRLGDDPHAPPPDRPGTGAPPNREREYDTVPLSYAQERLWFLGRFDPDNTAYNVAGHMRLRGPLDTDAVRAAFNQIIGRHEALRVAFRSVDGRPIAVVLPELHVEIPVVDAGGCNEATGDAFTRDRLREMVLAPFRLESPPLFRLVLVRRSPRDHSLLLVIHHILSDAWSIQVMAREFATIYGALVRGERAALPELDIQYGDFASWQRQYLQGERLERLGAYWREQFKGVGTVLELPLQAPRPRAASPLGAVEELQLPRGLRSALTRLGRVEASSPFMVLLAAYAVLLHRYSGQQEITIGSPIAGRMRAETEGLIGFFVNMLPLSARFDPSTTFRSALRRLRDVVLDAYDHQEMPFAKLVETLNPDRDLSHSPLFQVTLSYDSGPTEQVKIAGLAPAEVEIEPVTVPYPLNFFLTDTGRGIRARMAYQRELFDPGTIRRLLGHFRALLESAVTEPDTRVGDLRMLPLREERQITRGWNANHVSFRGAPCIHELFEAQVARTPDRIGAIWENHRLTYAALNRRANQLAHHLRARGVNPDVRVAILLERSLDMLVAVFAVLKAGGAYVPLDPAYPPGRLEFMLRNAEAAVMVTRRTLADALPVAHMQTVCLDADAELIGSEPATNPRSGASAENLIYVIYTSGSTGKPKGVMLSHRGIRNRLLAMQGEYGLTADDRILQKTSFTFDVSVWEIFWPLICGAATVLARAGGEQDPAYLVRLIEREGITMLHFIPPMLRILLQQPGAERCRSLRHVACGGELLPRELQEKFFDRVAAGLHNHYGPTEGSVEVTTWTCPRSPTRANAPIGRPVANVPVYILDARHRPVPAGISGELCLGGVAVARGYIGRPELTAERFLPDPFAPTAGGRVYRTGDLARFLPDGAIEFLGRLDHQVKVRGFRIELGEVEAALGEHPALEKVVVAAREDVPGERRLVAYFIAADAPPSVSELRRWLEERLPEYMIPAAFVPLDTLPLTATGKIDRAALPAPAARRADVEAAFSAPRTAIERELAAIWQQLLDLDRVGVEDNFFELGGYSLVATQVVSRVQERFRVELPLVRVFESPTIAQLATEIATLVLEAHEPAELERMLLEVEATPEAEAARLLAQEESQ